jgi:hypothetical protein
MRPPIYDRHCADAVLSFARNSTIVSMISTTLLEFVSRWTSTSSGYDFLIAHTMPAEWVEIYAPVISRRATGHVLYDKFCLGRPFGMILVCHWGCNGPVDFTLHSKDGLRIKCPQCDSRSTIPPPWTDRQTTLGRRKLVKVAYPPPQYRAVWEVPSRVQTPKPTSLPTAGFTRSKSATGSGATPNDRLAPESSRPRKRRSAQDLESSRRKR